MYLFFDTETNGLPKNWKAPVTQLDNWPRLVQLAFLVFDAEGNEAAQGDFIIKPDGFSIPDELAKIHGISNERAMAEGIPVDEVLGNFIEHLSAVQTVVAHNLSFDEKIMGSELLRAGHPNLLLKKNRICTMESSTNYCKIPGNYGFKWPKLSELHIKLFGLDFEEAHNATADISATAKCFWELKRLGIIQ
jgi:DNA polymerase-3 subunit epsilon